MKTLIKTLSLITALLLPSLAGEGGDSLHLSVEDQLTRARVLSTRDGQALSDELYRLKMFGQLKSTEVDLSEQKLRLEVGRDNVFSQSQIQYNNGQTELRLFRQDSTDQEVDLIGRAQNLQSQTQLNFRTDLGKRVWLELQGSEVQVGRQSFIDFEEQRGNGRLVVELMPRVTGSVSLLFLDQDGSNLKLKTNTLETGITYHGDPVYVSVYRGSEKLYDGDQENNDSSKTYLICSLGAARFIKLGPARVKPSVKYIQSHWRGVESELREQRILVGLEALIGPRTHLLLDYGLNTAEFSEGDVQRNEVLVLTLNHQFSDNTKLGLTATLENDRTSPNPARFSTGLHLSHRF